MLKLENLFPAFKGGGYSICNTANLVMLDWSYRWKIRTDKVACESTCILYYCVSHFVIRYFDSQCLKKAVEVCVVSRWYIKYLDSQGLRKVERAVAFQLFVRYVEGSTGNEPTESL